MRFQCAEELHAAPPDAAQRVVGPPNVDPLDALSRPTLDPGEAVSASSN